MNNLIENFKLKPLFLYTTRCHYSWKTHIFCVCHVPSTLLAIVWAKGKQLRESPQLEVTVEVGKQLDCSIF